MKQTDNELFEQLFVSGSCVISLSISRFPFFICSLQIDDLMGEWINEMIINLFKRFICKFFAQLTDEI